METIQYQTHGTCCRMILAQVDNGVVKDVQFAGGCMGNQAGIRALTRGMKIADVIERLALIAAAKGQAVPTSWRALCSRTWTSDYGSSISRVRKSFLTKATIPRGVLICTQGLSGTIPVSRTGVFSGISTIMPQSTHGA